MHKFFITLLSVLLFSTLSIADVVNKIEINGNKRISDETIKIYGNIKISKDYSEKDLNTILENLYSTNFFKNVNVQMNGGTLIVNLEEYPIINELIIIGEKTNKYVAEIKKLMNLKQKDSFIEANLAKDLDIIKKLYASLGYNFTQVETKVRKIDSSNLDLVIEISKGNRSKIQKIKFTGDKKVRERRLRDVIASEEDKFWKFISRNTNFSQNLIDLDKRLLQNYYKSIGYYDVSITSDSAEIKENGNVVLTYSIDAGAKYFIKKITTDVDPVFDKNIFFPLNKEYNKVIGSNYSPFKIKKLLDGIDDLILKNNLQFVEHNVEETVVGNSINIKFNIFEGEKVLVERINILGNNVTNEAVIRSELLIDEGDPYTNLGLEKSVSNIKSRNIFKTVKTKVKEGSSNNLKVIDISVEEQPTGEITAGAGIGTDGGSIAFTVSENNWLGEGKNIGVNVELDSDTLRGTLSYTDPNYDFLGNSISYYVSSESNDKPSQGYENTVTSAGISTKFEQYKDVYARLGISGSYDDLRTDSTASDSLKKQSGNFSEIAGNYGFTFDKRNRTFRPTDGSIINFSQTLPLYADKAFVSNTVAASTYNSFSENIIGAAKLYITAINGINDDNVRLSKRKNLSVRRLRGFESGKVGPKDGGDHIGGNYAAALNFEANFPNFLPEATNTDITGFLDFGNVWGVDYDDSINDASKIRSSTGLAASWLSPIGPMTFIFSTNISKATEDTTESFNFRLGTTF